MRRILRTRKENLLKPRIKLVKLTNNSPDFKSKMLKVQEQCETFISLFKDLHMNNKIGVHCSTILWTRLHNSTFKNLWVQLKTLTSTSKHEKVTSDFLLNIKTVRSTVAYEKLVNTGFRLSKSDPADQA